MRSYILLKRITGLREGDLLRLTPANVTDRGLELITGETKKAKLFRWSWAYASSSSRPSPPKAK